MTVFTEVELCCDGLAGLFLCPYDAKIYAPSVGLARAEAKSLGWTKDRVDDRTIDICNGCKADKV